MIRRPVTLAVIVISILLSINAWGQVSDQQKEEARSHFDLGLSHFDREEWQAALVEFLKSRELFPSRGNTKNAAICLRKVGRFDEALDMFEKLVHEFQDLSPADRALAQREITELQASVGTIDIQGASDGATVTIDSVERGKTPLKGPIRLSAGSHFVRVTKDGALPFETRIDLAGRQAAVVHAQLAALTQAGRLRVVEHQGKTAELVVDGAVVGHVPWEGALAPGAHTVFLRGEGTDGTPPSLVNIKLNDVASLDLTMQELAATLRVTPNPASAAVTIDEVPVGRGVWDGRLTVGTHKIAATLEGYGAFTRDIKLDSGDHAIVDAKLDVIAPPAGHSGIALEVDLGAPLGLLAASDMQSSSECTAGCSAGLPIGFEGVLHGTYIFGSGIGVGLRAGYVLLTNTISNRATTITSPGALVSQGTANDSLLFGGVIAGIDGQYRTRGDWPFTVRLGVGVFFGSTRDHRTGSFTAAKGGTYSVDTTQAPSAIYLFVAPEVRLGRKFGDHVEVSLGAELLVMPALSPPRWNQTTQVLTGTDGAGSFANDRLTSTVVIALVPSLGFKYEF